MKTSEPQTKRPLGLAFITFCTFAAGIALLPMGCTLNFVASSVPTAELAGIITSMAGILFATLAYGLWTYNETARKTTIALNYIGAALTIIQAFTKAIGHPTTLTPTCVITSLISIGIAIAINLYLQTEEVLDLFDDHEDQNWRNYHNR